MEIIRERRDRYETTYHLEYRWADDPHAGFSFDCDANGRVDESKLTPLGLRNYLKCLRDDRIVSNGIQEVERHIIDHAIGRCVCGHAVDLTGFTNTCPQCCRDYNFAGTELAPRECWGEETGEHWTECL